MSPNGRGAAELAQRVGLLGTETAFAVAAEAAALAQRGRTVYPFHLGDLNLETPANVVEAAVRAVRAGRTGYCPPLGIPELREAIAEEMARTRALACGPEHVAVQPGGKPVIGKFLLALMNPGDEVLYPSPGYPIYESQIEVHGGVAVPYGYLDGGEAFRIDLDGLEAAVTPRTRLLIVNDPQNPIGADCSLDELERLASIAIRHDLCVLCDEAYFDIRFEGTPRSLASLDGMPERSVILYTFSKTFAMTGWRLGAAIGPASLIDVIGKLNVNDESCTNQFVQVAGAEGLRGDRTGPQHIVDVLRHRRDVAIRALGRLPGVQCHTPRATFYLFADVTEAMARCRIDDVEAFRRDVLEATGVSFCTRVHFGRPLQGEARQYVRLAYSGIDADRIEEGLDALRGHLEARHA